MFYRKQVFLVLLVFCFLFATCKPAAADSLTLLERMMTASWAESTATITVEPYKGQYSYKIKYEIPESTAINNEGKAIKWPIEQYGISDKKPVNKQKIKIKYNPEEPVEFVFLEPMRFEE